MNKKELRSLANQITISRIFLGLPIILALTNNKLAIAWILIVIGGISDFLDGWLSRKADGGTALGSTIDPLADKVMLFAPLLWLSSQDFIPLWSLWLLITREIIISGWRSKDLKGAPASFLGKVKTTLQFISILMMVWPSAWNTIGDVNIIRNLGLIFFWPSLLIAIISGYTYIRIK